jgi:endonuclease/exonuclease/phosphatase family metal-dependent hydrolase
MGFSLVSLNLHCGLDRHGVPYRVTDAVADCEADVVLLQENWRPQGSPSLARTAAEKLGYPHVAEVDLVAGSPMADLKITRSTPVPDETGSLGLAILSRIPWREYRLLALGEAPGDRGGERFAQIVELTLAGHEALRVVNTHLTYRLAYGPGQIYRLITGLGRGLPTVIGGDLNMCRPTIGLAGPYRPAVRGRTWPAHRPVAQIDHLLAGPGVEVLRPEVLRDVGSDHRPVRGWVTPVRYVRDREPGTPSERLISA